MGLFLDRLCRTAKQVTLPNKAEVRVRTLSDVERRDCELHALRESALLVEKLRAQDSKEYQAILLPVRQGGADRIRDSLVAYRRVVFAREVGRDLPMQFIPFPDNAGDEERREVILKRDQAFKDLTERRAKRVDELIEAYRQSLTDKSESDLMALFDRQAADGNANGLYQDEVVRSTVYYATETPDGSKRYFTDLDEVRGLPTRVLTFLYEQYLEADSADPFLLPSPSATESSTA